MGKLVNLLRWKKEVALKDGDGKPILDEKGKEVRVWIRIIGDEAQQESYRLARIASAEKRFKLRDVTTPDYKDQVLPIMNADRETCVELITISRGSNFTGEALANVERPDLPLLSEVAKDADAPTLEEQETLDNAVLRVNTEYQQGIEDYVKTRGVELTAELEAMDIDTVRVNAMFETSNAIALNTFLVTVQDEKAWRSTYMDEKCSIPAYDSVEEFKEQHTLIRQQILEAYADLEIAPDEVKN